MLERDVSPPEIPSLHQRLARSVEQWPHFDPPRAQAKVQRTVLDVALTESVAEHMESAREWANQVWNAWSPQHVRVAALAAEHLG